MSQLLGATRYAPTSIMYERHGEAIRGLDTG